MDDKVIAKVAATVGLSNTTVAAVVSTYEELSAPPQPDYKCPNCDRPYKTAKGLKSHMAKQHKKGK